MTILNLFLFVLLVASREVHLESYQGESAEQSAEAFHDIDIQESGSSAYMVMRNLLSLPENTHGDLSESANIDNAISEWIESEKNALHSLESETEDKELENSNINEVYGMIVNELAKNEEENYEIELDSEPSDDRTLESVAPLEKLAPLQFRIYDSFNNKLIKETLVYEPAMVPTRVKKLKVVQLPVIKVY